MGIGFVVVFPLTFISNAFVPIDSMPTVLQWIASVNPISVLIAAVRELFGNPVTPVTHHVWPMDHPVAAAWLYSVALVVGRLRDRAAPLPRPHHRFDPWSRADLASGLVDAELVAQHVGDLAEGRVGRAAPPSSGRAGSACPAAAARTSARAASTAAWSRSARTSRHALGLLALELGVDREHLGLAGLGVGELVDARR